MVLYLFYYFKYYFYYYYYIIYDRHVIWYNIIIIIIISEPIQQSSTDETRNACHLLMEALKLREKYDFGNDKTKEKDAEDEDLFDLNNIIPDAKDVCCNIIVITHHHSSPSSPLSSPLPRCYSYSHFI